MRIAITGASGFVGKNLIQYLLEETDHEVVGFSRSAQKSLHPRLTMKKADLYSLLEAEEALAGCDAAVYLVHSMLPSSRLSQGSFQDFDFILADNFAKACITSGVKHIIYVGGIIPENESLSLHLKSRLEVEETLKHSGLKFTSLRCALVLGPNGSSFRILERLVDRLKVMVLPSWTKTKTQVTYIGDLVRVIEVCLQKPESTNQSYDLGSTEVMSYRRLIKSFSLVKQKKRLFVHVPFVPLQLSKLWVRLITGVSKNLVYPLIDSLKHKMLISNSRRFPSELYSNWTPVVEALKACIHNKKAEKSFSKKTTVADYQTDSFVQSVQRLHMPEHLSIHEVALEYMIWLPKFLGLLFRLKQKAHELDIGVHLFDISLLKLRLSKERTFDGRSLFYITGGILAVAHPKARLEFRQGPDQRFLIAAIHSFRPKLPWYVYIFTQAIFHKGVMFAFDQHLKRISKNPSKTLVRIAPL